MTNQQNSNPDCSYGKPWLKQYPDGVPPEIDTNRYPSLVHLIEEAFSEYGPQTAYSNFGAELTFSQVDTLSQAFANYLVHDLKLEKGDRVAVMMPNLLQYPIAVFGILRAGCTVVNTNPLYTPRELKHQLKDSETKAILVVENFAHVVEAVLEDVPTQHVLITSIGEMQGALKGKIVDFVIRKIKKMVPDWTIATVTPFKKALEKGAQLPDTTVSVSHDNIAFLQYTGGTTGLAKGAMLTHKNLIANVLQAGTWFSTLLKNDQELIITAIPLYHIFALTANCLFFFSIGGKNVLITNPRDMKAFVKTLSKHPFTAITGVNTLFNALLHHAPGFDRLDFSHLKMTLGGGMAVQKAVADKWKEVTGSTLVEAFGLTETSPAACINPMDLKNYNGSIGLPISSTECSVQDDEGQCLPPGETGELCIRGPQVMKGYWKNEAETASTITADGWLKTGDIATWDEQGYFYIVDRKKDMILVSGFNVYPNEIEAVAVEMPGILEAAAIGIADERSGEVVRLCVVKGDPDLTEDAVIQYCRKNLTGYKVPKQVMFYDELPKTNVGKILRRELKE